MNDALLGLEAVGKVSSTTTTLDKAIDAEGYAAQTSQQTEQAMSDMVRDALPSASSTLSTGNKQQGMIDGSDGTVDEHKESLVSEPKQSTVDTAALNQTTIAARQLYVELGRWNIAWGIAKRVQRDSNQIMRGQ